VTRAYAVSEGRKFSTDTTLEVVECYSCKMLYAIPASLNASAIKYPGQQQNGWTLFCPLGHQWYYLGRNIEQQLADERKAKQATRELLEHEQRSHAATRGHVTRKKKQLARVAHGVCPCCNRHFTNLERHMTTKHPDFATEAAHTPPTPEGTSGAGGAAR
jgi:hypothetical protein